MEQTGASFFVAGIALFLISAAWVWQTKRRLGNVMAHMGKMLDEAARGSFREQVYDESMLSSIEAKLADYLSSQELAKRKLAREKEEVKRLVSDISHQTKTPVANLILYAQMLKERELEHDARDFVNELCRQAGKLDFLIAALLKASRLETGMLVLKPQRRRVYPMLLEVRKQAERRAMEKRLAIEIKPDDSYAYFDPKWTAEAVYNVIDNAVKYTKEGGKITVEVLDMELFLRIEVRDNGVGIEEWETAKIFQRFYRGKTKESEGLGIGLYLSRQILAGEGGYIKVSSKVGEGSSFYLYLAKSFQNC